MSYEEEYTETTRNSNLNSDYLNSFKTEFPLTPEIELVIGIISSAIPAFDIEYVESDLLVLHWGLLPVEMSLEELRDGLNYAIYQELKDYTLQEQYKRVYDHSYPNKMGRNMNRFRGYLPDKMLKLEVWLETCKHKYERN